MTADNELGQRVGSELREEVEKRRGVRWGGKTGGIKTTKPT